MENSNYKINGINNKIIVMDNNEEYPLPLHDKIDGLDIFISGSNNLIKIDKHTIFKSSFFKLESNNSVIEIYQTQPICNMIVNCWENYQKFIWGKDSTTWGVNIYLNEEKASLVVGQNCMLSGNIDIWATDGHVILNNNEPINALTEAVTIGDHCWIGAHTIITKNAQIPNNTIVGIGSVVTKAFYEENTVIAGNPAKLIKKDVNWDRKTSFSWRHDVEQVKIMDNKNRKCKVSVIVSIYNSEDYMRVSLDSALNQTLKDIELICVYRASRDNTLAILKEYAAKDNRIKLYEQIDTVGCGPAKNQGISLATGEFITFLDADDYYSTNDCLEKLYNAAKERNVRICGGFRSFHFQDGSVVGHPLHREVCKGHPNGVLLQYIDFQFDYHFHSFLFDRIMIQENGFCFNDTLTYDDPHFFVRAMLFAEKFYVIPVEMYCYRLGEPYKWGRAQTIASAIAFIDILRLSRDEKLAILHWKTVSRINNGEYYDNFVKHMNEENVDLLKLMFEANDLVDKDLINKVQENMPPRGVLDTQDVCMDMIESTANGGYVLKPLRHILGPDKSAEVSDSKNCAQAQADMTRLERELQNELDGVHASVSYKVGRFFTWLPRKIRGGMKCYKEHGFKYTIDLISCKLRGRLKFKKKGAEVMSMAYIAPVCEPKTSIELEGTAEIKVSIVVPVFNVCKYLRECLDSIINQTLKDIEIICGDGGSNDGSLEILQEYATKDSRIKIISKDGSGYGQSVNECMDMARGKYIGLVESDDVITSDAYETLYSIAESMRVDWVRADIYYYYAMNEEGKRLEKESIIYGGDFYNILLNPQTDYRPYKSGLRTWSGIYNREFLNRNCIRHNETPGGSYQDTGFYLKNLYYATRVCFTDKAFYMWRQDNPSSSIHYNSQKLVEKSLNEWYLNKIYLENHPELGPRAVASYHYRQFYSYLWTIEMADEADRPNVFKLAVKEFRKAEWNKELDRGFFERWEWDKVQEMINNPDRFFVKYFNGKAREKASINLIIKRALKPLANFSRKITYKLMRDVVFQLERKIDDSANWNRQRLEETFNQMIADTSAIFQTDVEQMNENSRVEIGHIQEYVQADIEQIRENSRGEIGYIQECVQADMEQIRENSRVEIGYIQEHAKADIEQMQESYRETEGLFTYKISEIYDKLIELDRLATTYQAGDINRKNKDTVNSLVELLSNDGAFDKHEIVRKNLKQIEIEIFSYCNRRCWFCPNKQIDRHSENHFMPEDMYVKILSELREVGYSGTITYSRYNEPLADRTILKRVRQAREYCPNAFIRTNTNGDYLTPDYLNELAAAGMNEIEIQCYFNEDEEFNFDAYEERLKATANKLGIDGYDIIQHYEEDRINAILRYKDMRLSYFSLNMKRLANNRGETLDNTQAYSRTENCLIPFKQLYVDYNGSYMLCCNVRSDIDAHEGFILGNAQKDSIFDVFTGDKIIEYRKSLGTYANRVPPCSSCSYIIMDDDMKFV